MSMCRLILACLALAALTAFLAVAAFGVWIITGVAEQLPERMEAAVLETRGALLGEVADTRVELLRHLTALELRTDSRLGKIESDARLELEATRELVATRLDASLARVDVALAQTSGLVSEISPVLVHSASVAKQVDDNAGLWLDCEGNEDCLPNRTQGTLKAVERASINFGQMSTEIRKSLPAQLDAVTKIEQSTAGIAADVHHVTGDYLKPVGFWHKIWAAFKTGAILYVRTL